MLELHEAGAVGFSDDGVAIRSAGILRNVLEYSKMVDAPVIEHCEDESLAAGGAMNESFTSTLLGLQGIPNVAEDLIVMRDIMLAEFTRWARPYCSHKFKKMPLIWFVRQRKKE